MLTQLGFHLHSKRKLWMQWMRVMLRRYKRENTPYPYACLRRKQYFSARLFAYRKIRPSRRKSTICLRSEKAHRRQMLLPQKQPMHHLPASAFNLPLLSLRIKIWHRKRQAHLQFYAGVPHHRQRKNFEYSVFWRIVPVGSANAALELPQNVRLLQRYAAIMALQRKGLFVCGVEFGGDWFVAVAYAARVGAFNDAVDYVGQVNV